MIHSVFRASICKVRQFWITFVDTFLVKKKKIKFYSTCAYKRPLWVTAIVEYELSKLKHSEVQSVRSNFTQTMYKSVFNW